MSKLILGNNKITPISEAEHKRLMKTLSPLLWQVRNFVKQIVEDSVPNPQIYNMRVEFSEMHFKIMVHNMETDQIVGKAYQDMIFLEMARKKKLEFELNTEVKKLILISRDKFKEKVKWI